MPGGKGSTRRWGVAKLDAEAYLIGKVGRDYEGRQPIRLSPDKRCEHRRGFPPSQSGHGSRLCLRAEGRGRAASWWTRAPTACSPPRDILQNAAAFDNASFCLLQTEVGLDAVEAAAGLACEAGREASAQALRPSVS